MYSGIKPFLRNFQFRMVSDRGVFYHPSYLLSILMSYWSDYNHKQLAAIGRTILLELLDTLTTLSFWLPLPQHYEWCLMLVVSLPLTITSSLIQEKLSLFGFLYQAHHPVQLLHQSLCLVVNLSRWWTEPPIWVISCIRISLTQMIFWGFKPTCAVEPTASYPPFRPLTLLLRPSCFAPSVYLSMALHCGVWRHLVCILWKLPSIIYWGKFGSFLIIAILVFFTVLAGSKVCTMLSYNAQRCCVSKLELLVFHWSMTSSQKHPSCHTPVLVSTF